MNLYSNRMICLALCSSYIFIFLYNHITGGSVAFIVNGEETQFEEEVARVTQELVKHLDLRCWGTGMRTMNCCEMIEDGGWNPC